ncbi:MAG TPA: O-antigen ligase family protein [Terriglobia bacterium]|nr:O-antigen ligase family protein [Terriglobia bacterium]
MATTATVLRGQHSAEKVLPRAVSQSVPRPTTIARYLLVFTLMAAPTAFGAVQTWAWASLAVIAAVLLVLWAMGCAQNQAVSIRWSALYVPAVLYLLLGAVQFGRHLTLDPFATREALIKLLTSFVILFLVVQLWADASARMWKRLGMAVAIYALSMALFAIVQYFTSYGLIYWNIAAQGGDAFGPYVNHNNYAGLMEMLIPICLCFALYRSLKDSDQMLLIFGVCGAIASLLLSGSRGGMIAVAAEIAILGVIIWRRNKDRGNFRKWKIIGLVSAAGLAVALFAVTPNSGWQRLASIAGVVQTPDVTMENRLTVSRDALAALHDYRWFGTGLGTFDTVFPQYQTFPTDLAWTHAHNDYVEALTETGIVGGLIILSGLLLFAWLVIRNLRARNNDLQWWIQLGAALGCCGLLIHSFADFNLHIPANMAWFAACAGLAIAPAARSGSKQDVVAPVKSRRQA